MLADQPGSAGDQGAFTFTGSIKHASRLAFCIASSTSQMWASSLRLCRVMFMVTQECNLLLGMEEKINPLRFNNLRGATRFSVGAHRAQLPKVICFKNAAVDGAW